MPRPSERALGVARKTLSKIAAYDPYFPKPNESMLMAWGEHISIKNVSEEDMLEAVTRFYDSNTEMKPLPAAITVLARDIQRERSSRESTAQREAREARLDARVEGTAYYPDAPQLATDHGEKITLAEWERRHGEKFPRVALGKSVERDFSPLKVRCFWCKAQVGARCTIPGTAQELRDFHDARKAQVEGWCAPWAGWHVTPHSEECDR